MSDLKSLLALRDRLSTLTGPCREVDAEVAVAIDGYRFMAGIGSYEKWTPDGLIVGFPDYTGSLHAVEDLRQRLLPDSILRVIVGPWGPASAVLMLPPDTAPTQFSAGALTEILARLQVILQAMIAKSEIGPETVATAEEAPKDMAS